jgi:DNA-binding transcriptional LysR family regulator
MHAAVLRYFAIVARSGSIRAASEELNVASSAVSRQIQKLEQELGVELFERLPKGLRLTKAGMITLKHARATLDEFEMLKSELAAMSGNKTGLVRIASLDSLFVDFLPKQIIAFNRKHPGVDFRIQGGVHARIASLVAEGEADIGITFDLAHPEDTKLIHDISMPLMAMVSANHPLAQRPAVTISECAQYNLLLQLDTEPIRSLIEVELSVLERTGRVLAASNNLLILRAMVMAGLGVAFYTPLGMMRQIREGSMVAVPLRGTRLGGLRMGLLVPRNRRLIRAAQAMIDDLGAALTDLGESLKADLANAG